MKTTWDEIKGKLRETLESGVFKVWVEPLTAEIGDNELLVFAPNAFMANWVKGKLRCKIAEIAHTLTNCEFSADNIQIKIAAKKEPERKPETAEKILASAMPRSSQAILPIKTPMPKASIAWRYKFDDFVIGASNSLAVAAARDLCQQGQVRSLFVTSASGLGKTHLAQAAGELITASGTPVKVGYLTAEQFASRYVAAMRAKDLEGLKQHLCGLDVLVLEDVHFLQKKKAMQELILTVIKNLESKGSRIILTSSFAPMQLQDMDEQLTSHFCSGILANMQRPDNQMRKEILQKKAKNFHVYLPDEICSYLSDKISSDIRQLESCLQNMIFKSRLLNSGLTLDLAMEMAGQFGDAAKSLDLEGILKLVCESFGVTETQLRSRSRKHDYVQGRNTVFFLARKHTDLSLESIGNILNRRHSTVLRSITQVERELATESKEGRQIAKAVELIERRCGLGNCQI